MYEVPDTKEDFERFAARAAEAFAKLGVAPPPPPPAAICPNCSGTLEELWELHSRGGAVHLARCPPCGKCFSRAEPGREGESGWRVIDSPPAFLTDPNFDIKALMQNPCE